jgi:hypothetical protein
MPKSNPFAGIKLTDQTPLHESGLDQRLFSAPTKPVAPREQPVDDRGPKEASKQASNLASKEASNLGTKVPSTQGFRPTPSDSEQAFDINERAYQNNTFAFTTPELDGIEDLKLDLRRKLDLRATKNDIVRCGIHTLLEDYRRHGEDSIIVKRLRGRQIR